MLQVIVFLFIHPTLCGWGHPHQLIGYIGMTHLTPKENKILKKATGGYGLPEEDVALSSIWQDDLKDIHGLFVMANWHFSQIPFIQSDWDPSKGKLKADTYGVKEALISNLKTLNDPTTKSKWAVQYALRSLIHFIGDIHTPHHNVEYYSKDFPEGDAGGTKYFMNCNYGSTCMHIHFLWDAGGLRYQMAYPMNDITFDTFKKNASLIMKKHPKSNYKNLDESHLEEWINETYQIARRDGYSVPLRSWPSKEYLEIVGNDTDERIAAAGYRLGLILKKLLNSKHLPLDYNLSKGIGVSEIIAWTLNSALVVISIICIIFKFKRRREYVYQ